MIYNVRWYEEAGGSLALAKDHIEASI